jgi:hypothetical protein
MILDNGNRAIRLQHGRMRRSGGEQTGDEVKEEVSHRTVDPAPAPDHQVSQSLYGLDPGAVIAIAGRDLTPAALRQLVGRLRAFTQLTRLHLPDLQMPFQAAKELVACAAACPSLSMLNLDGNRVLQTLRAPTVPRWSEHERRHSRHQNAAQLGGLLALCPSLLRVNLRRNDINMASAEAMLMQLHTPVLKVLDLRGNPLPEATPQVLVALPRLRSAGHVKGILCRDERRRLLRAMADTCRQCYVWV